jgi:NitT/TauT family transport system ATP-binding protein
MSGASASGGTVIELDHVDRYFGAHAAVRDLSFTVMRGEIVALVGRTGAGKSTALHMIMGALEPSRGVVRVDGLDPFRQFRELRGRLAVSFQTDRLLPWRTALDNVALGLQILGRDKASREAKAIEWLANVKIVGDENVRKYPHQLSGGMRQRVSLARALAVDPALVLLDESFSQLDHVTSKTLRRDFTELARRLHKTCVLITHRIDDALEMADRVLVLAAPAKLALEVQVTDESRADPGWLAERHRRIAEAMGGEEPTEDDASVAVRH